MNDTFLSEVLRLSNAFRVENGLSPLVANEELDEAAQSHSEAMARRDFFDHTGLDGREPWDRAEDAGYDYQAIAENIAAGQRTPESVVNGWINSPGHRRNLLNPTYTDLGVGYFELEDDTGSVNYNTYWTQLFGSGDSVPAATPAPTLPVVTPDQTEETEAASEPLSEPEISLIEQLPPTGETSSVESPEEDIPVAETLPESESPVEDPTAEVPTDQTPPEETSVESEPTEESPDEDESISEEPVPEEPVPEEPVAEESVEEEPVLEEPVSEEPALEEPTERMTPAEETAMEESPTETTTTETGMAESGMTDVMTTDMSEMGEMPHSNNELYGDMAHADMPDAMGGNMSHSADHAELENLIRTAAPTHTAIKNGDWSDPTTWQNGQVPDDNAVVLIGEGTTVTYDAVSDARIKTVAVKGNLQFATNQDTQLIVETILNSETGELNIGSENQSVAADKRTKIIFTSDRTIDTQWDPTQLTKGLVSHGEVNIFGADKLDRVELAGDALAGNNVLTFKEVPTGWKVGDTIVVGGTEYGWNGNDQDNSRLQDEVLTITDIRDNEVRFTNDDIQSGNRNVLRFDHTQSRFADEGETSLYVANLTRNVSFETENGKAAPINQRAHVMLMHNPNVNVFNAGFYDLGRSDKTKLVDDIGENVDGSQGNGTNIRGRYSLHLHQMGVGSLDGTAALIKGNAISGSPGWGIVQHGSHAGLESNVVFDVVGAGIVAEDGNETGWWTGNTVIKTTGIDANAAARQEDARERRFDLGFEGDGYWVQGAAMIANKDNVAISSNSTGMELFGSILPSDRNNRPVSTIPIAQLPVELRSLFPADQTEVDIRDIPMATIEGFEAYNGTRGLEIWGHKTNFDGEGAFSENRSNRNPQELPETAHTGRSLVKDFKLWGNRWAGAQVQYSSNIDLENGLILGVNRDRTVGGMGLFSNHATFNSVYDNLKIAGFRQGAHIEYPNTDKDFITTTLKNSNFFDNTYNLSAVGDEAPKEGRPDDFGAFVRLENNQFDIAANNRAPVARFNTKAAGGLAVTLDASASSDADPLLPADGAPRALASNGIASYGWDLNNDGTLDRFGRTFEHVFDRAGSRQVALTVTDSQGQATTVQQTINVQPSAYRNAFIDGDFGANTLTQEPWKSSSQFSDQGWYVKEGSRISGGVARVSGPGEWNGFVGQVTRNDKVHRGAQTLRFRMKNIEGTPNEWEKNEVTVTLWGVNGQFDNNAWLETGPTAIGSLPMQRTELVKKVYGGKDGPASDFFDWKNISMDVDLGNGYDYLMFQVNSSASRDANDVVAIDNVSLTGEPNAIPGQLIPPNTLNPTVRPAQRLVPQSSPELVQEVPTQKTPPQEVPIVEQPPVAEESPKESEEYAGGKEPPVEEKTPTVEEPTVEEPTVAKETPIAGDLPVKEESSVEEDMPAVEELSVEEESLVEEDIPSAEEFPIEEDVPSAEESPIEEDIPAVEGPLAEENLAVEEPSIADDMPTVGETPASPDIAAEPIVQLSFEEALGRIAEDTATAGMANDAKLYGAEWTESGKVGGAIALDGDGDLIMLNSSPELNLGESVNQRTVSMWFNADDVSADKEQVLFEAGGLSQGGMNLYIEDDLLYFGAWSGVENGWQGSWVSTDQVRSGEWHHVAMVLDAPAKAQAGTKGTLSAYLDGQKVGETTGEALISHPDPIGLGNVSLTTRFENGYGFLGNSGLAGTVDEVQVFNDALSSQQVQQLALV